MAQLNVRQTRICFLPGRRLPKHRIERDQLENVDRLEPELGRDPGHSFIADETEMFLPQMQQRHRRAALVLRRIMPDRFIHFPLQLGGNTRARRVHDRRELFGQRAVLRLHLVVFENDRDRVVALSINVGRFLHDNEIVVVMEVGWPRIDSTCFFDIPSSPRPRSLS